MWLKQILHPDLISDDLAAKNKDDLLNELSEMMAKSTLNLDRSKIFNVLQHREKLGSTGIGDGVAIPHGKINNIEEIVLAFGRSRKGVHFDSIDGKPVYLFFMLLAPESCTTQHLKVLARISKMMKAADFRKKLMDADSSDDLYQIITEQDNTSIL